jgi:hypothetical protein
MEQTNVVEEIETNILISVTFFPESPTLYEMLDKQGYRHTLRILLITFAVQKSLHKCDTALRYNYTAHLVRYRYHFNGAPHSVLFYQRRWLISVSECIVKRALDTYFSLYLRGLCDELITRPEESYRLCCFVVCDLETSWMRGSRPNGGYRPQNKQT